MTQQHIYNLPIGAVINSYGEHARGKGLQKWLLRRAFGSIRTYQRAKYPHSEHTEAVHSILKVGHPDFFLSVTTPRALIYRFQPEPGHRYTAWLWTGLEQMTADSLYALRAYARTVEGKPYDYGQLLDIQINQWFKWLPDKLPLFDLGRTRKVCSVACHGALVAAWKAITKGASASDCKLDFVNCKFPLPGRPLGTQYIEHTCPADFENHSDFLLEA